jgi:hypothetical protein
MNAWETTLSVLLGAKVQNPRKINWSYKEPSIENQGGCANSNNMHRQISFWICCAT